MKKVAAPLAVLAAATAIGARAVDSRESRVESPAMTADVAGRIAGAAIVERGSWEILAHLTDRIGHRLSGSAGAAAAVAWTAERLRADGLEVRLEPVMVPRWVRGDETAAVTSPAPQELVVTALGMSVPTPPGGLEAEVVVADGLDALPQIADRARGRIVLFNQAMEAGNPARGYGTVVAQRSRGASAAARLGAVAVLVRSVGTLSARLPHTGGVDYGDGAPRIPAAALAAEDADLLARLASRGPVRVRLLLTCRQEPDVESANVVADLRGRERPEEIVLVGAHLDSWDLGTGAHDDGAGVAMVMDALRLLKAHGLVPRRTIRGVLFMNEENGLRGGRGYAAAHAAELSRHVAAVETDSGGFEPRGFGARVGEGGLERLRALLPFLSAVGATRITAAASGGADIDPMRPAGVPLLGLQVDGARYFDWHHTPADTLDKVDPNHLARSTAALALLAYALAEDPVPLPRPTPDPSPGPSASPAPSPR